MDKATVSALIKEFEQCIDLLVGLTTNPFDNMAWGMMKKFLDPDKLADLLAARFAAKGITATMIAPAK